ncbi:MAG: STAS/SEC14 domain-containing protein [Archangium gephyra]|uniref:STAS/SEC14 domain-containing protein n=1 Tax=Archangium gephyra TaxID=48 RepID=A0A2W5VP16_9BACT|nr:MAG: STAS/SEC14 domain-containing protein [Archangium gephyra]
MKTESFIITVHHADRVLEVQYPSRPTMSAYEQYETEIRKAILELEKSGPWDCLVDQTQLRALAPDFPPRIAELNVWSRVHGMHRTARVVSDSAVGELQTIRILKESGITDIGAVFHDRKDAWAFVTGQSKDDSSAKS